MSLEDQGVGKTASLKGVVGTKKLVSSGELGGKWPMLTLITAGQEKISADVVKETGAWGVGIEVNSSGKGLEDYIRSLQA